ncbi:MAG TPA: hypothetical protein VFQ53_33255 [Kofleriaceae bacterium]|nr:hypothetical protein [Kofleriaceae bacterium]
MRPALFWLATAALTVACGASPGDSPGTGPDGGGSNAPDGSGGGGATDGLLPLDVGRVWTYDVTSTYASCPGGRHDQRVTGTSSVEGRDVFEVAGFCGLTGRTHVEGNIVEDYYDWGPTGWYRSLDEPVADGHTWTTTNGSATFTQTYDELGAYGGREDCWKVIQNVSYKSEWIYCRGVGLVAYEMVDLAGGTIRAELVSTSF